MSSAARKTVELPEDQQAFAEKRVRSGHSPSVEDAVRVRVWTRITAALRDRLTGYCSASGIAERAVFESAFQQYIDGTSDMTLVLRRLNRLGRALERLQRDVELQSEGFAVFVRLWLAHTPNLPQDAKPAARAMAENRYRQFVEYVARQFSGGGRFLDDLPRERLTDDEIPTTVNNGPVAPDGSAANE